MAEETTPPSSPAAPVPRAEPGPLGAARRRPEIMRVASEPVIAAAEPVAERLARYMRGGTLSLAALPPLSLYVHLPWCLEKCPYCDFNSHALTAPRPTSTSVDPLGPRGAPSWPLGCGPAWERPGARPAGGLTT